MSQEEPYREYHEVPHYDAFGNLLPAGPCHLNQFELALLKAYIYVKAMKKLRSVYPLLLQSTVSRKCADPVSRDTIPGQTTF